MLAKNKCGWTLLEYLDIAESDICRYHNVYCLTISLAVKPDCITLTGSIA